jgi:hypothetical protein
MAFFIEDNFFNQIFGNWNDIEVIVEEMHYYTNDRNVQLVRKLMNASFALKRQL